VEKLEVNIPLDDALFSMPIVKKADAKPGAPEQKNQSVLTGK
jgi:hypothetical protein